MRKPLDSICKVAPLGGRKGGAPSSGSKPRCAGGGCSSCQPGALLASSECCSAARSPV